MILAASICCVIGGLVLARLAYLFATDVEYAFRDTDHHHENLPHVMADRYAMMAAFAVAAAWYGDLKVIAVLFAGFAFLGFADAVIYARAGKPIIKHALAGGAGAVVTLLAIAAHTTSGA